MPLIRLETLTDLVEFAERQQAKGSPYTSGWADSFTMAAWKKTIAYLREIIPKEELEKFDDYRHRKSEFLKQID